MPLKPQTFELATPLGDLLAITLRPPTVGQLRTVAKIMAEFDGNGWEISLRAIALLSGHSREMIDDLDLVDFATLAQAAAAMVSDQALVIMTPTRPKGRRTH